MAEKVFLRSNKNNFLRFGKPLETMVLSDLVGNTLKFIDVPPVPEALGSLAAVAISSSEILLSWSLGDSTLDNVEIYRGLTIDGPFNLIDTISGSLSSYSDTGLNSSTTYYYTVRGEFGGAFTEFSNVASAITEEGELIAPDNVSVATTSDTEISGSALAGQAYNGGAKTYISTVSGGPYTLLNTIAGPLADNDPIAITATGLISETTYYFVVRGIVDGVETGNSTQVSDETFEERFIYFPSGFNNSVLASAVDSNGDLYFGGSFTEYNSTSVNRIVKIHGSGANKYEIDTSFDIGTGFNGTIRVIRINSLDEVYVGGDFSSYNGVSKNILIRLSQDGSVDSSFDIGTKFNAANPGIFDIALDSSEKVYVVGNFTSFDSSTNNRIIKLNTDGTKDATFDNTTGFQSYPSNIRIDSNNRIVAFGGGNYKGVATNGISKINTDGSRYGTFDSGTGLTNPSTIYVSGDKVYIGTTASGTYKGVATKGLIRVNDDGSKDGTFDVGSGFNNTVGLVTIVGADLLVFGNFSSVDGTSIDNFIAIDSSGVQNTDYDGYANTTNTVSFTSGPLLKTNSDNSLFIGASMTSYRGSTTLRLMKFNFY
jgi:hypothetical protein